MSGANLENAQLDGAKVATQDWLDLLQAEEVTGLNTILPLFKVSGQEQKDEYDRAYYLVERK